MRFSLYKPQAIHELGQRANQEDTIYPVMGEATEQNRVFLVCDGMGGHEKGEVASAAVCKGISEAVEAHLTSDRPFTKSDFVQALDHAYGVLDEADVNKEGTMGTTMTFLCLHRGGCLAAHIGDSRIYHLRPSTGEVLYRSRDHSLVQQLYELGELSYDEMKTSPRKNVILRAVQPYQDEPSKPAFVLIKDIQPGDYFYMCSDGMLEEMEDDELMAIVGGELSDEEKKDELIRRTVDSADNHSAYLIHIKEVLPEEGDEAYPSDEEEQRKRNKALNDTQKNVAWDMFPPTSNHVASSPLAMGQVPSAADSPTLPAGVKTTEKRTRKNVLVWLLPLVLVVALGVSACFLFCGKSTDAVAEDEEEATTPQQNIVSKPLIPLQGSDEQQVPEEETEITKPVTSPTEDDIVDFVINGPGNSESSGVPQQQVVVQSAADENATGEKQAPKE